MIRCWKCKRKREEKYMKFSKRANAYQCKALAVCKNIRNRRKSGRGPKLT